MNFDEFTGETQHRLELPGTGEAVRAIRATLVTLGRRIPEGNAEDLAAYHARVVVDLVETRVPESDFQQLRDLLPEDDDEEGWGALFEIVDAGGWTETGE